MTGRHYSDETLMAYADGELPPDLMQEIDAAVAVDPSMAERVALFAETRSLAGTLPDAEVPPALRSAIEAMIRNAAQPAATPKTVREAANSNLPPAWRRVAAAAAIAVVAAGIGYSAARFGGETAMIEVAQSPSNEISRHLSTLPSGGRVDLADTQGELEIVGTFPVGAVTCREFEVAPATGPSTIAIACNTDGAWTTTFAITQGDAGRAFIPASGAETLDAYLASIAAGAMLDDAQENDFLKGLNRE